MLNDTFPIRILANRPSFRFLIFKKSIVIVFVFMSKSITVIGYQILNKYRKILDTFCVIRSIAYKPFKQNKLSYMWDNTQYNKDCE